jgi:C_GCAxxG_C_C family probable redox protein
MGVHSDKAARLFDSGFNCAQSVFLAFAPELGMDEKTAARVACPFGAGMGRRARTCGAVSGALLALGLRFGMTSCSDQEAKEKTYELTRDFIAAFEKRHGALDCSALLGCDIGTPEGLAEMRDKGLHGTVCAGLVRSAAEMAERLL